MFKHTQSILLEWVDEQMNFICSSVKFRHKTFFYFVQLLLLMYYSCIVCRQLLTIRRIWLCKLFSNEIDLEMLKSLSKHTCKKKWKEKKMCFNTWSIFFCIMSSLMSKKRFLHFSVKKLFHEIRSVINIAFVVILDFIFLVSQELIIIY